MFMLAFSLVRYILFTLLFFFLIIGGIDSPHLKLNYIKNGKDVKVKS